MFEFHGWASIRVPDSEQKDFSRIGEGPEVEAIKRVRSLINEFHDEFSLLEIRLTGNGLIVLIVHGLRNHRFDAIIDLFRRVGIELPDSYGLLYIHDDESADRGNEFRVWRLARGKLEELADPFLSPCIPTIEPPYEG